MRISAMTASVGAIHGIVERDLAGVRTTFEENFALRRDLGAAVCVYRQGKPVVDLWGGLARDGEPWAEHTVVCAWSTAKPIVALAIARLVEHRRISLDQPVASVWPEFGQHGKASATLRMVLTHTVGLPWFPDHVETVSLDEPDLFQDYPRIIKALGAAPPVWVPGTRFGYHSWTYGWLLGEIVRRVSGRPISVFIRDELCSPIGVTDIWFGVPRPELGRVAHLVADEALDGDKTASDMAPDTPLGRTFLMGPKRRLGRAIRETINDSAFLTAEVPGSGLVTNARSLARLFAALAGGGALDGARIIDSDTLAEFTHEARAGRDSIWPMSWRIGLGIGRTIDGGFYYGPSPSAFGHGGLGGCIVFADPERDLSFAYVTNRVADGLGTDPRARALIDSVYASLPGR
jgi:CubicO group peptidase (beta-lactamase class C family)